MGRSFAVLVLSIVAGCAEKPPGDPAPRSEASSTREPPLNACPTGQIDVEAAPDVEPKHREASFWLDRLGPAADEQLLDANAIADHHRGLTTVDGSYRDVLSAEVGDQASTQTHLAERGSWLEQRVRTGKYLEGRPRAYSLAAATVSAAAEIDEFHVVTSESQAYCVPTTDGLFSPSTGAAQTAAWDPDFDRNNCSSLHAGELVRALRRSEDGAWWHVHAGHSVGWLHDPPWTPALAPAAAKRYRDSSPRAVMMRDDVKVAGSSFRIGTSIPILAEREDAWTVETPGPDGLLRAELATDMGAVGSVPALTRRNLFDLAFSQLDAPYGWGGHAGGRDCSRYVYDNFAAFGLLLGRHSSVQAQLGIESVSVAEHVEQTKREEIRAAAERGAVLLYMPGHIMLYLGRDAEHDYAISSLSEFLAPCPGGVDTVHRLDRVAVTTLDVGRGTERTSFIERIDRIAIFGPTTATPE